VGLGWLFFRRVEDAIDWLTTLKNVTPADKVDRLDALIVRIARIDANYYYGDHGDDYTLLGYVIVTKPDDTFHAKVLVASGDEEPEFKLMDADEFEKWLSRDDP
jgi:hypothetical protein